MSLIKLVHSNYFQTLLKNPTFLHSSHFYTTQSTKNAKKPLHLLFTEAVGLSEKAQKSDENWDTDDKNELNKKLKNLEKQVRKLKEMSENDGKMEKMRKSELERSKSEKNEYPSGKMEKYENAKLGKQKSEKNESQVDKKMKNVEKKDESLYNLFASEKNKVGGTIRDLEVDSTVYKKLSPDMANFVTYLYHEGYFSDANFVPRDKFDLSCFENSYARSFIQCAAEKFGKDKQDIAQWVSASDVKKVALFGCPSLGKKNIFSAKKLRTFFKVHEASVCSKCTLKESCKFPNQGVWKHDTNNVDMGALMRVLALYALESTHPQLVVTEEIKDAVTHLLKEILNLSRKFA